MTVPSIQFLIFTLLGAVFYNIGPWIMWRRTVLLAVNIIFLGSFSTDPIAFLPFSGFLLFGFISMRFLQSSRSSLLLFFIIVCACLFFFFWLKKYSFVPDDILLKYPFVTIGLSYVFFRVLHLVIDSYQNAIAKVSLLEYINYTLNFTSLTAGPIQLYQDYQRTQQGRPPDLNEFVVGEAVERIAIGFFKVAVVSMLLMQLHRAEIATFESDLSFSNRVLIGALVVTTYPVYLYFNFSGYVDTVIGAARLYRIELPENFNRPFHQRISSSFGAVGTSRYRCG
jgi:alginate O-acetyltransferase complex protein AlgI